MNKVLITDFATAMKGLKIQAALMIGCQRLLLMAKLRERLLMNGKSNQELKPVDMTGYTNQIGE